MMIVLTLEEARAIIKEEIPSLVCGDLDLPDGSGVELLDVVRAVDRNLPFILASCHEKEDYEKEAMDRGVTLCVNKLESSLLWVSLVEYADKQLSGELSLGFL